MSSKKKHLHKESDLCNGDKFALYISRLMSSWKFIISLSILTFYVIFEYHILSEGKPLDLLNIIVSLYTIFVELVLLRGGQTQRNMDRALSEKIDTGLEFMMIQDKRMLKLEERILEQNEKIFAILKEKEA